MFQKFLREKNPLCYDRILSNQQKINLYFNILLYYQFDIIFDFQFILMMD